MKLQVIAQNDIQAEEFLRSNYGIEGPIKCEMVGAVRRHLDHIWNITIREDLGHVENVYSVEFEGTMVMMLPRVAKKETEYIIA